MSNEQNLKPIRSTEEARERGRKGGKASGEARRRKKALKERLQTALECAAEGEAAKKIAKSIGVDPNDATNYDVVIARLMLQAFKGDTRAMQMIFNYMGETPEEQRAEKEEARQEKLFRLQMEQIDNLSKDNDAVMQYINAMKKNVKENDTAGTEQETS